MSRRRRIEITVEQEEVLVVRDGPRSLRAWCAACGAEMEMLTPEEAAVLSGMSVRALFRQVEAGTLHSAETREGLLLICPRALLAGRPPSDT